MKKVVMLNGSLAGAHGNTAALIEKFCAGLPDIQFQQIILAETQDILALEPVLRAADGFVLATGTYWQGWGSPLQRFFEQATPWEATDVWLGKPACTLVTMHSIGGLEVMSRLQSNLNMLGAFVPPMCCLAYSDVNHRLAQNQGGASDQDVWNLDALPTIWHNFSQALSGTNDFQAWDVGRGEAVTKVWLT